MWRASATSSTTCRLPRAPRAPAFPEDRSRHPGAADQVRHRKNKGSRGGRPVGYDADQYKNRNVIDRPTQRAPPP
jgi:hypothetical protein